MMFAQRATYLLFALLLSTSTFAQGGRVGAKVPEFQLQSTEGKFYGIRYANKQVTVLHVVGFD